jgi:tRNA(Ile)-lysidine synthase
MSPRNSYLVRPLLNCPREELEAFAKEKNLLWREDASNATDNYLRNRVRHHLSPVFFEEFGLKPENLAKTLSNLRADQYFAREGVDLLRRTKSKMLGTTLIVDRKGWSTQRKLMDFLHHVAGTPYHFKEEDIRQLLSFTGQRMIANRFAKAYATPNVIAFEVANRSTVNTLREQEILKLPATTPQYGDFQLSIELVDRPDILREDGVFYLRSSNLPLHLRARQIGDRIMPLGMQNHKKVKDILIDNKVPVWEREMVPVLCATDGEIMALVGECISENYKVRPEDQRVLKLTLRKQQSFSRL